MAGFWLRVYSQIFRGAGITRWKSRWNVGKVEKFGGMVEEFLEEEIPKLEEEHRVTKFLKKFTEFVHNVKKAGGNVFQIIFNEITQDLTEEKEIAALLNDIGKNIRSMPRKAKNVVKYYLLQAGKNLEAEVHKERKEYWEVSAVVNQAAKFRTDREAFMAKIRTWFKTKVSLRNVLEKPVWRFEISASRKGIMNTRLLRHQVNTTLRNVAIHFKDKKVDKLTDELELELKNASDAIAKMFNESYLVKERAIIRVLKIMYVAETVDEKVKIEVNRHFAPEKPVEEIEDKLGQAVEHIGKEFHDVIEQGFRISIHKLEQEEKEIMKIEQLAEV